MGEECLEIAPQTSRRERAQKLARWGHLPIAALFFAAWIVVIAGCRVGPDFVPPGAQVAERWGQTPQQAIVYQPPRVWEWWYEFDDPMLHALVRDASLENIELREAYFRVLEARSRRGVVRGDLFPNVDGIGGYDFRRSSGNGSPFVRTTTGSYDFFTLGFDASWEIDVWGRVRRAVEAADAEILVSEDDYDNVLTTLIADVAATYVDLRVTQERIRVAQRNVELQERTLEVASERARQGLVSQLDVAQAGSNLYTTRSTIPLLHEQLIQNANRLCVLLGRPPHDILAALGDQQSIPQVQGSVAVGFPADLLRSRPDVRAAEQDVAAQSAQIGVAVADYYPRFSLNGTVNVDSTTVSTLFVPASLAHNVGPNFQWNLLSFGRIRNNIAVQRNRYETAVARYEQTVLLAAEDVENALVAYVREQERLALLDRAVAEAERAVLFARERYGAGKVSFQSVVDTERSLFLLQERQTSSRGAVSLNRIAIYKALGGGWSDQFYTPDTLVEHGEPAEEIAPGH